MSGARILDLGCNCGYETKRMRELGLVPVGLDFSDKSINLAREKIMTFSLYVITCLMIYLIWVNLMVLLLLHL